MLKALGQRFRDEGHPRGITTLHPIAAGDMYGVKGIDWIAQDGLLSRVLAEERGLRIVSGRTESHVFLVDLRPKNITGKEAEAALGKAHITVNKNSIPNDPQKPMVTSGIRIGTPAMTTRGFTEIEAEEVAHLIDHEMPFLRCVRYDGRRYAHQRGWRHCASPSALPVLRQAFLHL